MVALNPLSHRVCEQPTTAETSQEKMAEAVVEEPFEMVDYFCHKCGVGISHVLDGYKCPTCLMGFIEQLDDSSGREDNGPDEDSEDDEMDGFDIMDHYNEMFGLGLEHSGHQRDQLRQLTGGPLANFTRGRYRGRLPNAGPREYEPFDNVIQDLIVNVTGVGWGPVGPGGRGNGPVFFLGNPGDYAWGREGLDAIVTQLLNQMDVAGPPPLDKDKIQGIPSAPITQDQADAKLQCSVCWEDFVVGENVKKLECEHVYHELCIVPWLELHGTCPICRKSLMGEPEERQQTAQGPIGGLTAFLRNAFAAQPFNSTASSTSQDTTANASNTTPGTRREQSPPDNQMDFEFD